LVLSLLLGHDRAPVGNWNSEVSSDMASVRDTSTAGTYHPLAYEFVFSALKYTQEQLGRDRSSESTGHISGPELLEGIRQLGVQHFGMLSPVVFKRWGINVTDDFGRIVFQLIEAGEMRKTQDDQLDDFLGVYEFAKVFLEDYTLDTSAAFIQKA
jgi:uncharacterized repeat protein (TIGR04138 family)